MLSSNPAAVDSLHTPQACTVAECFYEWFYDRKAVRFELGGGE